MPGNKRALIVVDIQNDFMPGGALAVPDGDATVAVANAAMATHDLVVATQDWHPPDHKSFAAQHPGRAPGELITLEGLSQVLWPTHCVQHSKGADFTRGLNVSRFDKIFQKGTNPLIDSYSGFFDNGHRQSTGMGDWLKHRGVTHVSVLGVATDYCVKFTALDAALAGFHVSLLAAGCRGVNLQTGDSDRAIEAMRSAGVIIRDNINEGNS